MPIFLVLFSKLVLRMLKTKDKAKEMEYKLVFLGEEAACCLPPCPAKCCSGVRSCWAGQAAQQAWLCTQGTAVPVGPCCKTHHQLVSAAPAQPSKHQHPVISTGAGPAFPPPNVPSSKSSFSTYSTQNLLWLLGQVQHPSYLQKNCQQLTSEMAEGKIQVST